MGNSEICSYIRIRIINCIQIDKTENECNRKRMLNYVYGTMTTDQKKQNKSKIGGASIILD